MKKSVVKLLNIKYQFVRKLRVCTEWELFGFELSVLESKTLPVKIFQIQDMLDETEQYWDTTDGLKI